MAHLEGPEGQHVVFMATLNMYYFKIHDKKINKIKYMTVGFSSDKVTCVQAESLKNTRRYRSSQHLTAHPLGFPERRPAP